MINLAEVTDAELGKYFAWPQEALAVVGLTLRDVRAELARRQEERLLTYKYIGSDQHYRDIIGKMVADTHAGGTPPWEE